jgi:hypothetical protein
VLSKKSNQQIFRGWRDIQMSDVTDLLPEDFWGRPPSPCDGPVERGAENEGIKNSLKRRRRESLLRRPTWLAGNELRPQAFLRQ